MKLNVFVLYIDYTKNMY